MNKANSKEERKLYLVATVPSNLGGTKNGRVLSEALYVYAPDAIAAKRVAWGWERELYGGNHQMTEDDLDYFAIIAEGALAEKQYDEAMDRHVSEDIECSEIRSLHERR